MHTSPRSTSTEILRIYNEQTSAEPTSQAHSHHLHIVKRHLNESGGVPYNAKLLETGQLVFVMLIFIVESGGRQKRTALY
jgi:hypothetical protein